MYGTSDGCCYGGIFLGEQLGGCQVAGILVILLAVSLVILTNSREGLKLKQIPLRIRRSFF